MPSHTASLVFESENSKSSAAKRLTVVVASLSHSSLTDTSMTEATNGEAIGEPATGLCVILRLALSVHASEARARTNSVTSGTV